MVSFVFINVYPLCLFDFFSELLVYQGKQFAFNIVVFMPSHTPTAMLFIYFPSEKNILTSNKTLFFTLVLNNNINFSFRKSFLKINQTENHTHSVIRGKRNLKNEVLLGNMYLAYFKLWKVISRNNVCEKSPMVYDF